MGKAVEVGSYYYGPKTRIWRVQLSQRLKINHQRDSQEADAASEVSGQPRQIAISFTFP